MRRLTEEEMKAYEVKNQQWIQEHCTCGECRIKTGPYSTVLVGSFECKKEELRTRYKRDQSREIPLWESLPFRCEICAKTEKESNFKLRLTLNKKTNKNTLICGACAIMLGKQESETFVRTSYTKTLSKEEQNRSCYGCGKEEKDCKKIYRSKDDEHDYCSSCNFWRNMCKKKGLTYIRLLDRPADLEKFNAKELQRQKVKEFLLKKQENRKATT